jgi:hypothetical protein
MSWYDGRETCGCPQSSAVRVLQLEVGLPVPFCEVDIHMNHALVEGAEYVIFGDLFLKFVRVGLV